ncbi:DUF1963 domain-containing protein [Erythrobacter dokdonensis]|uniref:DUF1963 domain-containing protein n=1 Tax=Erythrobacter dokdonensis TaxID=328225 RepID=UPI00083B7544|nr:DUF1963 domain-containing protein [Erythrobacter dokdonensis]
MAKRLDNAPLAIFDSLDKVLPWKVLDTYVSPPASADGLDPDPVANLEPRLRNLECDKPHKPGGQIDAVYGDPLKKGHILLFQPASDTANGWICGDLGLVYVSIDAADTEAGNFDRVTAWLEAWRAVREADIPVSTQLQSWAAGPRDPESCVSPSVVISSS